MKCLGDHVTEPALRDDLLEKSLIAVFKVRLSFRPANRPCRLEETCINGDVSEVAVFEDCVVHGVHRSCMAEPHIVLNARIVDHLRVVVQDNFCGEVIQFLLPLLILGLLIVSNRR